MCHSPHCYTIYSKYNMVTCVSARGSIVSAAVEEELSKLVDRIESPVFSIVGGRRITSGYIAGKFVRALITGPGSVNTVQSLTAG
jgi:hypothetical protein